MKRRRERQRARNRVVPTRPRGGGRGPGGRGSAMHDDSAATSVTLLRQLGDATNHAAWRAFLARYQPMIHAWCCRSGLRRDDAEEVTEAVLCRLARALPTFAY